MKRRTITSLTLAGALLVVGGTRGICRERVKRPVVRFIDFYQTAGTQLPVWERIAFGLAIAAHEPTPEACTRGS